MAELKKIPFDKVTDDKIVMTFNKNPNIPTANYSDETLVSITEAIKKKMKADKVKKLIETELRSEDNNESNEMNFVFTFKGM